MQTVIFALAFLLALPLQIAASPASLDMLSARQSQEGTQQGSLGGQCPNGQVEAGAGDCQAFCDVYVNDPSCPH